ncbi:MAG TPA: Xaa-Pro peptidase family protein [bacterium]|nr:Xaa-Pro peptidase family protein [bacterium]
MERAQAAVAGHRLDALLVTSPENMCYLAGFATPGYHVFQALVVPASRPPFLVVRNIEEDNVKGGAWVQRFYAIDNLDAPLETLAAACAEEHVDTGRIGVEVDGARQSMTRVDLLAASLPRAEFVPDTGTVDALRAVKSPREIDCVRQAVAIAESAMVAGARVLSTARTDSDVAAAVQAELAASGSEFTGSPPYVVEGRASERTHAQHGRRPLRQDGYVWLEVPASVQRYQGVSGRIAGTAVPEVTRRFFDVSVRALEAMIEALRPGVTAGEVDAAGRTVAERAGAGPYWRNRAAYSLGLSFPPGLGEGHIIDIKPRDPRRIRAGMVFHFIPILKVPSVGAVGCTETVLAGEDGGKRLGRLDFAPLAPETADVSFLLGGLG